MFRKIKLLGEILKKQLIMFCKNGVLGIAGILSDIKEFDLQRATDKFINMYYER